MQRLRRSVFITFFSTNAYAALQFGVTLVLARLLTPSEVGIFSITVMLTNIAAIFRDFGVSSYIQREKDLTAEKIRSALGFLLTTSWLIAAGIYVCSDMAASFYNEPGIGKVMRVLALSFVLVPFASFFYALMARNLEAGKQAIVNGVGTVVYAISCLGLAWIGFSYMALAWASVINIAATILVYLILKPGHISLRPGFSHWREIAHFGSGALVGGVIDKINVAVPDLLLGKISGPHDVGLYSRAGGLIGIFSQIAGPTINYNAVPFLAKTFHEGKPLSPLLGKATAYLTAVSWPIFICVAFFPTEIIRVLYGPTWVEAAPIAVVLAVVSIIRMGSSLSGAGLMAIGKPYLSAASSIASVVARVGLILLLGAHDLLTFAVAIAVADVVTLAVPMWMMSKHMGFTFRLAARAHWHSVLVCLPCVALAWGLAATLPPGMPDAVKLIILSVLIVLSWLIAVVRFGHPLLEEMPGIINRVLPAAMAKRANQLFAKLSPHA
jgi:O-antigen/teichoic acid export membrane protein